MKKEKKRRLEDYFSGTQFELELASALKEFGPKHIMSCINNPDLDYENHGTDPEKKIKQILKYYTSIAVVLRDLNLTFGFLQKDRATILEHYQFLDSQAIYFKYHYENYFIRLITISDLVGKLGTIIYGFKLDLEKVSAYHLKDKARKEGYTEIAGITEKLILKLSDLKIERHKKLHTGETDGKLFNEAFIWENLNAIIGIETNETFKQYTDQKVKEEIEILESNTMELIDIVKEFLEESTIKLKEIIDAANI